MSNNQQQHHHKRHHKQNRPTPKQGGNGQAPLQSGSVIFRMLCPVDTAGGVIGNSGNLIKQLETQTGCKIRFEEPLPNCQERVINVIGDSVIDKKIKLKNENEGGGGWPPQRGDDHGGGECLEMEVSSAQSGLMRVFDRILQVKKNETIGVIGCRLLAGSGQVGGVMGRGGKIVLEMQKNSGAKIRVLNKDQTPSCAGPGEELIQISGDVMAVKKALVAVSHCLQVCQLPQERKKLHFIPESQGLPADSLERNHTMPQCVPGCGLSSVSISLSEDVQNILRFAKESAQRNVAFRLLCSNVTAGGVIGKGASVVRELEKQSGASIKFSSPATGLKDRVATISSMERRDVSTSPAQNATVLVFARSVEVDLANGYLPNLSGNVTTTARVLVTPNEINCLIDDRGKIASDISTDPSVKIQLLEAKLAPNGPSANDKVVQIVGEYEKVKSALFQVTGRLRDNFFSNSKPGERGPRQHCFGKPSSIPSAKCTTPQLDNPSKLNQTNGPGFALQNAIHRHKLPHEQFEEMRKARNPKDSSQNSNGGASPQKSMDVEVQTIAVLVPENAFANVYGENGSNLTRIIEISGAKVIVEHPCRGRSDGKVLISGTQENILVAQSLLQAFIGI